ncbi:deaminase [Amphritea sp. HPY]|uniref:nucleoside deaminase n=1 Tax=Amphritea sp. HPY TaxID=3421652 RepID=UPI003D7EE7DD
MPQSHDPDQLQNLIQRLDNIHPDPRMHDDANGLICCRLALDALEQGNYGVAAVLISPMGEVVAQAENRVFSHGYNSAAHAEMLLLDLLEQETIGYAPAQLTMLVSLEPCPMCMTRLLLSGIGTVRYMTKDADGGMLTHLDKLPPAWRNLAQLQNHYPAHLSDSIRELAAELAGMNLVHLRHKLFIHIRP